MYAVYTLFVSTKAVKVFSNGGSQAVRLPAELRFDGSEVYIRRDERTGDVILSKKRGWNSWQEYFETRDQDKGVVPEEFMSERPLNSPFRDKNLFEDDK